MSVTPMARFKEDFKSIKKILKENIEGFRDLSLNKVDPKWNYHKKEGSGYTKGVNSDFIRIFSLNKDLGIAFSFNDIDSEECYIFSSVKEKGKVVKSKDSFEETKKKVKEFISHLKTLSVLDECTDKKVKTVFTKVFLQEKIYSEEDNFENVLKKTQKKIDKILNNAQAKNKRTPPLTFLMIRRPPRSTRKESSAASDVYKRQVREIQKRFIYCIYYLKI